ncbi:MAG TPA: F0F1 ATP synthase subunit A, partial [Candidatus Limnocylindrales bacterium]
WLPRGDVPRGAPRTKEAHIVTGNIAILGYGLSAIGPGVGIGLKVAGAGSYVMAFVLTIFEILIEFLQAYIFTLLAATYIAGSLVDEH